MRLANHILLHHQGHGMNKSQPGRTRSIKVESCTYPARNFLMGELGAKLGSLSHLQSGDIFSSLPLDQTFLSFPLASTLTSDQKCLPYHMEMTANIHRVSLAYLLFMAKEMRKRKERGFTYIAKLKMSFVSYGEARHNPHSMLHCIP